MRSYKYILNVCRALTRAMTFEYRQSRRSPSGLGVSTLARALRCSTFAILWWASPVLQAQTGSGYDLTWSTIDSGGETFSTGDGYELGGAIGQADAGELTGDNGYSLTGGFWEGAGCGACILYADVADPRCIVEIGDVLFILSGYASSDPCSTHPTADISPCNQPCTIVELGDLLAVLNAYAGVYECAHPCPP